MKNHYLKMLDYELWANHRIIQMLLSVNQEQIPERVVEIFSHILAAQRIWYSRITDQVCPVKVWEKVPINEWESRLNENIALLKDLVNQFSEQDYNRIISYSNSFGLAYKNPIGEIFNHFPMHSAYHRGQIVILIRKELDKVPLLDYIQFAREML